MLSSIVWNRLAPSFRPAVLLPFFFGSGLLVFFFERLPFPMMVEPDPTLSGYLPVLRSACPTI